MIMIILNSTMSLGVIEATAINTQNIHIWTGFISKPIVISLNVNFLLKISLAMLC